MKFLSKNPTYRLFPLSLYSILISTIAVLASFYTENFFITVAKPEPIAYISSKIIYFICIYFASNFLIAFIFNVIKRDTFHIKWIKYLLLLGIPYMIIFFVSWPGIIVWDEFWVYKCASELVLDDWQSFLTVYYYLVNLYLFPSIATVVFTQIAFLIFVSSWFIVKIEEEFQINWLVKCILILILILNPAIVFSTLTTYRSTMLAIIELWLIGLIYFCLKKNKNIDWTLFWIVICTIILSIWRKEGIYHLVMVPLAVYFINSKINRRKVIWLFVISIVGVISVNNFASLFKDDNINMRYEITAMINPISNILVDDNVNINKEMLDVFGKIIDVEKTKELSYPYEIPAYWNGAVANKFSKDNLIDFKKQYFKLVLDNLDIFASSRMRTMLGSSGLSPYGHYVSDYIINYNSKIDHVNQVDVTMNNKLNQPITDFRKHIIKVLNWSTNFSGVVNNAIIFWNFVPIMIILIIIVLRVDKISSPLFWISLLSVTRAPVLYLAEPGSYFMYYYPLYLTGIFIFAIYILNVINTKRNNIECHQTQQKE